MEATKATASMVVARVPFSIFLLQVIYPSSMKNCLALQRVLCTYLILHMEATKAPASYGRCPGALFNFFWYKYTVPFINEKWTCLSKNKSTKLSYFQSVTSYLRNIPGTSSLPFYTRIANLLEKDIVGNSYNMLGTRVKLDNPSYLVCVYVFQGKLNQLWKPTWCCAGNFNHFLS